MAKIILNAKLTKIKKEYPAGIMQSIKGRGDMGLIDDRRITYKDKSVFEAGILWDPNKRILSLTEESRKSNANIAIFASTYPVSLVEGKILVYEYFNVGKDAASICYKRDIGGYDGGLDNPDVIEVLAEGLVGIKAKDVSLYLMVATASKKVVLKNSEGFLFVCDFEKEKWFVLKPGSEVLEEYDAKDLERNSFLKESLPFPGLDRKLYDEAVNLVESGYFDIKKHAIKYV